MVPPAGPNPLNPQLIQQFLRSVLSQRGPSALPYFENTKWLICTHLVSLTSAHPSLEPKTAMGYKSFEVEGNQVEVYWDLRSAKFGGGPGPCSDFYVALVCDQEIVLLLGDMKKKAYKRTKSRPALVEALLYYKKENVFAKKSFATRVKFDKNRKEHDIVVESSTSGSKDPEMWISIDGIVLIHVKNLQWKFRGNQTLQVNMQPVQVFWDVHDWLFSSPGTGHGLFIFKPGLPESESDHDRDGNGGIDSDHSSPYYSTQTSNSTSSDFCLFLHAYKIE
ncbi:hypothetical protein ACFX1T_024291 [Malus domestica]